ncbi:hypothetical protein K9L63_02235 [Candidatus Gracilibacteria bacterium]|nr:hypothetical protein [Candidatus Gracilibacteria bacterium]
MIAWLLIPAGILMILYAEKIVGFSGEIACAEKWFGSGGTYTFMKLLGLAVTILSIMWISGGLEIFLRATLGVFIPGVK